MNIRRYLMPNIAGMGRVMCDEYICVHKIVNQLVFMRNINCIDSFI